MSIPYTLAPSGDDLQQTLLGNYMVKRLSGHGDLLDSKERVITRIVLEGTALTIVICARVAMTQICLTGSAAILDEKITDPGALTMGIINATGAVISFGCLSAFTKLKIVEVLTRYIPPTEQQLMSDDISSCTRNAIKTTAVVIGFSSQFPMAIGAYNSALFAPMFNGVFTFLDGGRASWSMYNTIMSMFQLRREPKEGTAAQVLAAKKNILKQIDNYRALLSSKDFVIPKELGGQGVGSSVISDEEGTFEGANAPKDADAVYVNTINTILLSKEVPKGTEPLSTPVTAVVNFMIVLMAASVYAEFYKLGEDGAGLVTDNTIAKACFASYVVFANLNLWWGLINKTTYATVDLARGANTAPLTRKVAPKFYDRFTKWGTWISLPTFVPTVYFAKLYFPTLYVPVAALSSTAGFLGGLSALFGLRDILIRRSHSADEVVILDRKLEQIRETVSNTNLPHIAVFLAALTDEVRGKLKSPNKLGLETYISDNCKNDNQLVQVNAMHNKGEEGS